MQKLIWYLRQMLPLTYRSHYHTMNGEKHFAVWNMVFGKVYNHEDHIVLGG